MKTEEPTYIDVTPIDLWRLGSKNSPRIDKPRVPPRPNNGTIDIQTYLNNGETWVKAGSGGISTFDKINLRLNGEHWWRIPENATIPFGLKITKNHKDRVLGITHYRIEPVHDMPLSKFIELLTDFSRHAQCVFGASVQTERLSNEI